MTTYSMIAWDTGSQQDVMWTTTDYSAIPLSTETSPNYTGTLVEICILDDEGDAGVAVLTTTDWNTATTTGFYTCANTCLNAPLAQALFGEVFVYTNNDILQRVYFNNVIYRQEFVRHRYSGTWTNWTEISEQIEVSDWNNAVDNGFYYCGASTTNAPTTGSYLGTVVSKRAAYDGVLYDVSQTLEDISGATRKVWNRFKLSAGAWSAWAEVAGGAETNLANRNTKKGEDALLNVDLTGTGGFDNSAFGWQALKVNTLGDYNSAFGSRALTSNNGICNSAFGFEALLSNLENYNSAFGVSSMYLNSYGYENSAFGYQSLFSNTSGRYNSAFGVYASHNNSTGQCNSAFGYQSLYANTGSNNTAFGGYSLWNNTSGTENVAVGYLALGYETTGFYNSAIGSQSLLSLSTGSNNVAVGYYAGVNLQTGTYNVALGSYALCGKSTGTRSAAYNIGIGQYSLYVVTTAQQNVAIGDGALKNLMTSLNNVAIGHYAGLGIEGNYNTFVGATAGMNLATGTNNVMLGVDAGIKLNITGSLTNSSSCIYIGKDSRALADSCTNEIVIGADGRGNGSNTTTIGNSSTTATYIPYGNFVLGNAALATTATTGFLHIPSCAGTPTGIPTAYTGRNPLVIDSTNAKLYFYAGGWKTAQDALVSGTNIKTINSTSLLGSGDIAISGITGTGSIDNRLLRSSGTAGNALDASVITVDDAGEIYGYTGKLNLQTGTTYTLAASDAGKVIDHSNASAITTTLPNNLPVGFCCTYSQTGAGQVTFSAESGATLNSYTSKTKIAGQYAAVTIWVRSNSTGTNASYVIAGAMA